jgi:hypothetical protein
MMVSGQQPEAVLDGLAGKPEVLNAVAMLSTGRPNLRGQAAKDISRGGVYGQKRLAREAVEGSQPLLADSRVSNDFRAKPEFRDGDGRNENRFALGQRRHIGRRQGPSLHVNPHAGID